MSRGAEDSDASFRKLRSRIGGLALAAQQDPVAYKARARAAFLSRFEAEVDPLGGLPQEERSRRATAARQLYFARLALKSAGARRRKKDRRCEPSLACLATKGGTSDPH